MGGLTLAERLKELAGDIWCDWTHGGGSVERDELGRINWQCRKCKRWGKHPVPLRSEKSATAAVEGTALGPDTRR
jgi:hypothetical protein